MGAASPADRVGTLFAGRYRLESILGTGSSGVVYEAKHAWTGRTVALKLLKPDLADDAEAVRRFMQEARSASEVVHPNVVQMLDMGAEDDGAVFLVMDRFEGESLEDRLARDETLSLEETLRVLVPVMDALSLAHERGVVHRDLKPANVFLHQERGGVVPKLLDFGLSKLLDVQWIKATQSGVTVGTPFYMSPEQAEARDQGPWCDVWGMGVVLYRTLSGKLPFRGASGPKLLMQIVEGHAAPIDSVIALPEPVAAVIDRALTRDLEVRYTNMSEMLEALERACGEANVAWPSLDRSAERDDFDPGPRDAPPSRWRYGAVAAVMALGLVGALWWAWSASL